MRSSSFKMALLFTVMLSISAGILGYFLYDFGRQDFLRETEAAIDAEIAVLSTLSSGQSGNLENAKEYINERSATDTAVGFRYEDSEGIRLAGNLDALPKNVKKLKEGVLLFWVDKLNKKQSFAAKIYTFPDSSKIIVARDIDGFIASHDRLKQLSILIMGLMLCVIIVSFVISYFVVNRINRIAITAQNIVSTGDLSQRISIDTEWDDLSNLAQVLNGFLEQIEGLMLGVSEVSNNIAHDLRTPLTRLRGDIETLRGKVVSSHDLDNLLEETDRILNVFQSILRITNIEKGKRYQSFCEVDLSTILHDVIDLYEPLAEEKEIRLINEINQTLMMKGDPDLLFQLFANLLDNAIKFSQFASEVRVTATTTAGKTRIIVKDSGPGISEAEKELVFRPFFRGDESRSSEGNGLGLSLVKAIVTQHRGDILLKDANPGLAVWVEL